ncbi:hypothetical protein N7462_002324 [Penicillium macrosclerotiorum]|uniref:uncharacterized protein n=1 Tax=Penicillium macrosclerotiorum TaxID=303699 RepID=UPI002548E766|nr:uncharacterized protein N7462_002324 [Penicillium macrosclerotiorum]KAJ5692901.1 hypothetical protein N7462_002324 [Penicillium macrosclerotiorum]
MSGTTLHCDVSDSLHIAVKQSSDPTTSSQLPPDTSSETESDSDPGYEVQNQSEASKPLARPHLARAVSWSSIVRSRCRWTSKQEKELLMAEKQLARCQKAWSSEQELWLAYIQALSEEKEAHEGFMMMRMRQQEEERCQFRKAWKRQRSVETAPHLKQDDSPTTASGNNRFNKLRRLHRYGYVAPALTTTETTALACQG